MKTFKNLKFIGLIALFIGFTACNDEEDFEQFLDEPPMEEVIFPALTSGSADFSNYVAIGASFTAGFTDGALFIAAQENSFTNTLAAQFEKTGGGTFNQPLMNDNIGGLVLGSTVLANPRLFFNGSGPQVLPATPTTSITSSLAADGSIFSNVGVPGAKSTHIDFDGYATLNPYFGRFANAPTISMLDYAIAQNPSFFTLSEVGGNDVLGYATSGGDGTDPITPTGTFDAAFNSMVNQLTAVCPNGVVTNVPYITDLPHFTTVPHNPLDPANPAFGPQIPTLNATFASLNGAFNFLGMPERAIVFSETEPSPVIIHDESLPNIQAQLNAVLTGGGLDAATAGILSAQFAQSRQATADDLLVLPSSSIIATLNTAYFSQLVAAGVPQATAGQLSVNGVTFPLEDKWVLLPSEQMEIRTATDAYNSTIASVASSKNLALVDLNAILTQASNSGVVFDDFNLTTDLVTGGLVSLDGIHLNARGYAYMANAFLDAIDASYGSNFRASGNVAKADNFGVIYSPSL